MTLNGLMSRTTISRGDAATAAATDNGRLFGGRRVPGGPARNFVVFNLSTGTLHVRGITVTLERVRADALGVPRKGAR